MLTKRLHKYLAWMFLALLVLFVAVPRFAFPGEGDYRRIIQDAKNVELQYLPAPNYTRHFTMATISSGERSLLDRLAKSIDFRGVWVPFTDVSGNVYRIRASKNDGSWEDVVVLGANKIRHGNWNMPISREAVETIKQVVVESGGRLPDNDILFELLNQRQRNVPTEREIQESSDGEGAAPGPRS